MTTILGAAASGLAHAQQLVHVIGHNLANVDTPSFKRIRAVGEGTPVAATEPGSGRMGVALTTLDLIPVVGVADRDDAPLHFAIQDDAFFRLRDRDDTFVFSRLGALSIDVSGNIVGPGGRLLDPPITLPEGSTLPSIDATGVISALDAEGVREDLGQVAVVRFVNPAGLEEIGEGLYRETGNSGATIDGAPGSDEFEPFIAGALEGSNVDLAEEFTNLLVAQRTYQACAKLFSVGDEMLAIATDLTR